MARGLLVGLFCGCVVGGAILAGAALRHGVASVASHTESGSEMAGDREPKAEQVVMQAEAPVASEIPSAPVMVAPPSVAPEAPVPPPGDAVRTDQIASPETTATGPEDLPGPVIAAAPPVMTEPAPSAAGVGPTRAPGLHTPAGMPAAPDALAPVPEAVAMASDAPEPTPPPLGPEMAGQPGAGTASDTPEAPNDAVARIGMASTTDEPSVVGFHLSSAAPPSPSAAPDVAEGMIQLPAAGPGPHAPPLPFIKGEEASTERTLQAFLAPIPDPAALPRIDQAPPAPATTTFDRNRLPPAAGELPMIAFLVKSLRSDLPDWSMSFVGSRPPGEGAESFRSANGVAYRSAGSIITQDIPAATAISAAAVTGEALVVFPRDASVCVDAAERGVPCAQVYTRLRRDDDRNGYRLDAALLRAQRDGIAIVALPDDGALRALVDGWLERHRSDVALVPVSTIIDRWR